MFVISVPTTRCRRLTVWSRRRRSHGSVATWRRTEKSASPNRRSSKTTSKHTGREHFSRKPCIMVDIKWSWGGGRGGGGWENLPRQTGGLRRLQVSTQVEDTSQQEREKNQNVSYHVWLFTAEVVFSYSSFVNVLEKSNHTSDECQDPLLRKDRDSQ